jgi:hypothetical protein
MQLVFDLTFCGGYAGGNYDETCGDQPASCRDAAPTGATAKCWDAVQSARRSLLGRPPPEFGGCLTAASSDAEIQASLDEGLLPFSPILVYADSPYRSNKIVAVRNNSAPSLC